MKIAITIVYKKKIIIIILIIKYNTLYILIAKNLEK